MLKFELSKLVDYIGRFGKCSINIKINEKQTTDIEVYVNENGELNLNDEEIKQILSILYGESFLRITDLDNRKYTVLDSFAKSLGSLKNALILANVLMLYGYSFEANVVPPIQENEERNNDKEKEAKKLALYISKMLLYSEPIEDTDISIIAIYKSLNTAFQQEDVLADKSSEDIVQVLDSKLIPEVVRMKTERLIAERKMKKAHMETISVIEILVALQEVLDEGKGITDERLNTVLKKHGYSQLREEFQQNIQQFIKEAFNKDIENKSHTENEDHEMF